MAYDVTVEKEINKSRAEVYDALMNFGGVKELLPDMVAKCDCKGSGVGAVREIELADGVLSVSYDGPKTEVINGENKVVYQGIAQRAFKQQFTLSEDVVVQGAELVNGLLAINLEKIIPDEKKPRMIEIKSPKRISSK